MTIDEAIELLTDLDKRGHFALGDDITPAIKLGIEALKRVKGARLDPYTRQQQLLPGETKD